MTTSQILAFIFKAQLNKLKLEVDWVLLRAFPHSGTPFIVNSPHEMLYIFIIVTVFSIFYSL